ncbi:UNKNOWN [Stylonychia lemnae]|uniref:Uncharacterized protein n=1 Tax=Stylonychia lemnae TaxID=5949 RepID=A0A078ATH5_STYLE|nr:UNKNOWN [Stylonychia lemnae]|eukprot:CDW85306.1 UNKNOWN [Stylonychia lemnae]
MCDKSLLENQIINAMLGNSSMTYRDQFNETRNNTVSGYKSMPESNAVFSERTQQYTNQDRQNRMDHKQQSMIAKGTFIKQEYNLYDPQILDSTMPVEQKLPNDLVSFNYSSRNKENSTVAMVSQRLNQTIEHDNKASTRQSFALGQIMEKNINKPQVINMHQQQYIQKQKLPDHNQTLELGQQVSSRRKSHHYIQGVNKENKTKLAKSHSKTKINQSKLSNYNTQNINGNHQSHSSFIQSNSFINAKKSPRTQVQSNYITKNCESLQENSQSMEILNFSRENHLNGSLKFDLINQQQFTRKEVLQVLQFYLTNFKPKTLLQQQEVNIESLAEIRNQFDSIERIVREQSYSMIMFMDMFKDIDSLKYSNPQLYKILAKYPQCENVDLKLEEVINKIQSCRELIFKLNQDQTSIQDTLCQSSSQRNILPDTDHTIKQSETIRRSKRQERIPSCQSGSGGVKDKLKKGSIKMYQYLSHQTQRFNPSANSQSQNNLMISKSPRSHPQQQFQLNQAQSMLRELESKNLKIKKLEDKILDLEQIIDQNDQQAKQMHNKNVEMQNLFGSQEQNINTIECQRQEITQLLLDKTKLLQQIDKLNTDCEKLRGLSLGTSNVSQLERLIQMLSNFLISKKYNQFSGNNRKENDNFIISENERQLMILLFGDVSNYNKLKQKYRNQTKKYLKELRFEQENFLLIYKLSNYLIEKIQSLKDLVGFFSNQSDNKQRTDHLRLIQDFIQNNLSVVNEDFESIKLKILLKDDKKKTRKNNNNTNSGSQQKQASGIFKYQTQQEQQFNSNLNVSSSMSAQSQILNQFIQADQSTIERNHDSFNQLDFHLRSQNKDVFIELDELEEDDILDGIQTPPESYKWIIEKNLDKVSVLSTPMFNRNFNEGGQQEGNKQYR